VSPRQLEKIGRTIQSYLNLKLVEALMEIATLYVTTASLVEAKQIARTLVEERLAACANILDPMTSIYRWEGELRQDRETVLLLKTPPGLITQATARIKSLHSYKCPCIVAWRSAGGNEEYLKWVQAETGERVNG
jgi:periplasmic divalent cation tolerance protein